MYFIFASQNFSEKEITAGYDAPDALAKRVRLTSVKLDPSPRQEKLWLQRS